MLQNRCYSVYGQNLRTTHDFDGLLTEALGPPNLDYYQVRTVDPSGWRAAGVIYESPHCNSHGVPRLRIWRQPGLCRALISGVGTYEWTISAITCVPKPGALDERLTITLLGAVFSWWLEEQGLATLHASALSIGEHAVAFLATNKGGKSTLAATLMQTDHALLTDDVLAIDGKRDAFVGHPSYPQMRLWPDQARHFVANYRDLERVHPAFSKLRIPVGPAGFGSFAVEPLPLRCIYLPERRDADETGTEIQISAISPRDALIELIRHSFSARTIEAFGFQDRRIDFFARLLQQAPMRRLVYPSGFERLPRVRDAILNDLSILA